MYWVLSYACFTLIAQLENKTIAILANMESIENLQTAIHQLGRKQTRSLQVNFTNKRREQIPIQFNGQQNIG